MSQTRPPKSNDDDDDDETNTITIRPRIPKDLPACASLLSSVYDSDGYPVQGPSGAEDFLAQPQTLQSWVAVRPLSANANDTHDDTQDVEIVGHVCLSSPSDSDPAVALWRSQQQQQQPDATNGATRLGLAVLERLFVHPNARGDGVAQRLISTAVRFARRQEASRGWTVVLFALQKDLGAMRLYDRTGWREFGRKVYKYQDREGVDREMGAVCYAMETDA